MKPSVLRYLNPFYFEIRFLSWAAWSNIAIGCLLLPISIYLSLCWNQIMQKAADFTPTEDEYLASSDIEKLRHFAKLAVKLNRDFMGNINDVLYGFALLALGIFLLFLWNAFLLRKAHSLLKPENGDRRS